MSGSASSYPYDAIVLIEDEIGGRYYHGSGVLVAPDEVLTASHLAYQAGIGTATNIYVAPAADGGSSPYGYDFGVSFHYNPIDDSNDRISIQDSQSDYALIRLSRGFGDSVGTMGIEADFGGGSATISGYPGLSGVPVSKVQSFAQDPDYTVFDSPSLGPGSSGGPVWVSLADGPYVTGLASSGGTAGGAGYFSQITNAALTQIEGWEAQDAASPQIGALRDAIPADAGTRDTSVSLDGPHTQYALIDNGQAYVAETIGAATSGENLASSVTQVRFSDGVGFYDPTGVSETVARLYQAALNRPPDLDGYSDWVAEARSGQVPLSQIAAGFTGSPEFIAAYGAADGPGFVADLYQNVLGRAGDAAGVQFWDQRLAGGESSADVVLAFADSPEDIARTTGFTGDPDTSEAYRLYRAALDRVPDGPGLQDWTSRLGAGAAPVSVAQGFLGSAEYMSRFGGVSDAGFVQSLYENVLGRAPDAQGFADWTQRLAGGQSRAQVLLGFSDSVENKIATEPATHDGWTFVHA